MSAFMGACVAYSYDVRESPTSAAVKLINLSRIVNVLPRHRVLYTIEKSGCIHGAICNVRVWTLQHRAGACAIVCSKRSRRVEIRTKVRYLVK